MLKAQGAHNRFLDRDARPRTNLNYPKNGMTQNSNPKKLHDLKFKPEKTQWFEMQTAKTNPRG